MSISRRVLSLSKTKDGGDKDTTETRIPIGIFDVQLPARQFFVHHKVAEVGDVSLTTEFLLRLLYSADGIKEDAAALFFGFNATEMAYVVKDAETRAYISRSEGRMWLTDAGQALFKEGDKPQIYDVVKRMEKVGFDLLSLAPCDRDYQSDFERALPELPIRSVDLAANASKYVPESFRRFYKELSNRKDKDAADLLKRALYSVDEVTPSDRFSSIVSFVAMANVRRPGEPEPFLEAWRMGHELSDRDQVVHGIGEFLESLRTSKTPEDANAFDVLTDFAPEYLKEYVNKSGFAALRYFKEITGRAGELRSDRQTVGILGALYQPENIERISTAIGYTKERAIGRDVAFIWVVPNQPTWGASRSFLTLIEKLAQEGILSDGSGKAPPRVPIVVGNEKPSRHLARALPATYARPQNGSIPSSLEILLVPGRVVAITVHAPITESRGFPVPMGVLSFDAAIVRRVHHYLTLQLPSKLPRYGGADWFELENCLEWIEQAAIQPDQEQLST